MPFNQLKYFDNDKKLTAILSATSICLKILPERNAYLTVYNYFEDLFNSLNSDDFFRKYVLWERFLLSELGYNVDLENKDSLKLFNKNITLLEVHIFIDVKNSINNEKPKSSVYFKKKTRLRRIPPHAYWAKYRVI